MLEFLLPACAGCEGSASSEALPELGHLLCFHCASVSNKTIKNLFKKTTWKRKEPKHGYHENRNKKRDNSYHGTVYRSQERLKIKNILIRRESDTYLAIVSRYRWSSWITMSTDNSQVGDALSPYYY